MNQISPEELRQWIDADRTFQLVDVREEWEHEAFNIGGVLIPLGDLMSRADSLGGDWPVVFYCEKGIRSVIAIQRLEALVPGTLYNLTGGMKAWRMSADG